MKKAQSIGHLLLALGLSLNSGLALAQGPACLEFFALAGATAHPLSLKQGEAQLRQLISQLSIQELGRVSKIEIGSYLPPANGEKETVVFKVTYTNSEKKEEVLSFYGELETGSKVWKFDYAPSTASVSTRDQYLSLKMGELRGEAEYVYALTAVEIQSVILQIEKNRDVLPLDQQEAVYRFGLMVRSYQGGQSVKTLSRAWKALKIKLANENLRKFELSPQSLDQVLTTKNIFDVQGKILGEPNSKTLSQFYAGNLGDQFVLNDGLGARLEVLRQKDQSFSLNLTFLSKEATTEELKSWFKEWQGISASQIHQDSIPGFQHLKRVRVSASLKSSETGSLTSLVSELAGGYFRFKRGTILGNMTTVTIPGVNLSENAQTTKLYVEKTLKSRNITSDSLSLDDRIALIQEGYLVYLAELRAKNPQGIIAKDKLFLSDIRYVLEQVFPEMPKDQKEEFEKRARAETDDFLNGIGHLFGKD